MITQTTEYHQNREPWEILSFFGAMFTGFLSFQVITFAMEYIAILRLCYMI